LKNKKGAKTQKFIQQVEKQVKSGGNHPVQEVDKKKLEKEKKLKVSFVVFVSLDLEKVHINNIDCRF
jgi:hypothetical protein